MNAQERGKRSVGLAGVVLPVLGSLGIADDAADREAKRLEGMWRIVSLTVDGEEAPRAFVQTGRWFLRGGEITLSGAGEGKGSFMLDPSRSPRAIDLIRNRLDPLSFVG